MLQARNCMGLLSSESLSESVTSIRAAFRRPKRALFGGAFLFPVAFDSLCYRRRWTRIGGITKKKQPHFLAPSVHVFGSKKQTAPSPPKSWLPDLALVATRFAWWQSVNLHHRIPPAACPYGGVL